MVNTSDRPVSVDGVRLDTLAWNITKITRGTAARRSADVTVPGRDGALPSLNDNLEPVLFGLEMFVMGTNADGGVPPAGRRDTLRTNLDELVHLFGKRHALLEVCEVGPGGIARRALAKVVDRIEPDLNAPGSSGQFTVSLSIPAGVWEDVATADWNGALGDAYNTPQEVTSLRGATERTTDAVILVTGPCTNPKVTDISTGAYVQLMHDLPAGSFWRVNVGTWASRYGSGLGLGSADTTGTDAQAITRYGGTPNQAAFLPLVPARVSATDPARRVLVGLASTNTFSAATRVSIRARRKYAL